MASPVPLIEALEASHIIQLTVLDDMRLFIYPAEVARDAEHNSATFRIARQPASLDGFVCRAEVQTSQGTNYRLVENGEFVLTNDIAVQGINTLQLIYSDGAQIVRKTYQAPFHVSRSINAVDPSDPDFENGLAQLQAAAFTAVQGSDSAATFYNLAGQPVGIVVYPPGQGGGIDEAQGNLLYVRRDGANTITGSLFMQPSAGTDAPIGLTIGGRFAQLRWDGALILTRGQANEPVVIEDNNGANRSPILTGLTGVTKSGDQMTGPLITYTGTGPTNPGLGIGDNATGFYRSGNALLLSISGQMYMQWLASPQSVMLTVPLNMALQPITNVADPNMAGDAANRRYVDAAVAAIPRPAIPASRTYLGNEVTIPIDGTPVEFFNTPFFTNDNAPRTVLVTVYPQFASGTQGAFYDLEYSTGLSAGLIEVVSVYPTPGGYMGGAPAICFAATVTPVSSQIQVSLAVRQTSNQPAPMIQIGSRATQRSYVVIQEMTQ